MKERGQGLKQLEKRAHLMYHRDGITDLALGVLVVLFGLGMKYDQTLLAPVYGCIGYPVWILMKQWITEKRIGYVEFGEARKKREKKGWILIFLLGCVVFLFGIMSYQLVMSGSTGWLAGIRGYLMVSVVFAVLISSIGMVLDLTRLHLYSVLLLFMGCAGQLLDWRRETGILMPGILIVVVGVTLLATFLIQYPKGGPGPGDLNKASGEVEP